MRIDDRDRHEVFADIWYWVIGLSTRSMPYPPILVGRKVGAGTCASRMDVHSFTGLSWLLISTIRFSFLPRNEESAVFTQVVHNQIGSATVSLGSVASVVLVVRSQTHRPD